MWLAVAVLSVLPFAFFDLWYFVRGVLVLLIASSEASVKDILREQAVRGIVLLQDIDFLGHMNNSRYLRECDFARETTGGGVHKCSGEVFDAVLERDTAGALWFSLYIRNGLFQATRKLKANMVLGAATIRYRRSLHLFEQFKIQSRILCWDEKAFYIEQEFISCRDSFVCATMLCRQNVLYSTPDKLLQLLCKRKVECPDFPEEVQLWINYNLASSARLKA